MKFFSTLSFALATSVLAVPLQERAIKVGALDTILATMTTTLAQNQDITNQAIYQARVGAASEIRLVQQMVDGVAQIGGNLTSSGLQIATVLQNSGTTLSAPFIVYLTQSMQQAVMIAKSTLTTFQAQGNASAAAFSAASTAIIKAEIFAAESALQPFIIPMLAFAKTVQSDGSDSAAATMAGLKTATDNSVALVKSVNDVLGISTS